MAVSPRRIRGGPRGDRSARLRGRSWTAYAELLAARGEDHACRTAAAAALRDTEDGGYLILVPRLREPADS